MCGREKGKICGWGGENKIEKEDERRKENVMKKQ